MYIAYGLDLGSRPCKEMLCMDAYQLHSDMVKGKSFCACVVLCIYPGVTMNVRLVAVHGHFSVQLCTQDLAHSTFLWFNFSFHGLISQNWGQIKSYLFLLIC